jgi:hypothetical protein
MISKHFNDLIPNPPLPPFINQILTLYNYWEDDDLEDIVVAAGGFQVLSSKTYEYSGPVLEDDAHNLVTGPNTIEFTYTLNLRDVFDKEGNRFPEDLPASAYKLPILTHRSPEIWLIRKTDGDLVWFDNEKEYQIVRNLLEVDHVV